MIWLHASDLFKYWYLNMYVYLYLNTTGKIGAKGMEHSVQHCPRVYPFKYVLRYPSPSVIYWHLQKNCCHKLHAFFAIKIVIIKVPCPRLQGYYRKLRKQFLLT